MVIIFDLDGTLADIEHRRHLVTDGNVDWDNFYKLCIDDSPNMPIVELYKTLQKSGKYTMTIFSGRGEIAKKETKKWLKDNFIKYDILKMRPKGDYTPDEILKLGWLKELQQKEMIMCVFDDRKKVVDMWRKQGLICCQVAKGDF